MLLAHPGVIAALLMVLALGLRVVEVQLAPYTPINDARSYLKLGGEIASSGDYASDRRGAGGTRRGPSAYFAPGYPYLLGALDAVTGNRPTSQPQVQVDRLAQAVLGTVAVGLIGLIALELSGVDMALLAMALAAIYPVMIELSSVLVAETLLSVLELAAVWSALRLRLSPHVLRWTVPTGLFTGLATLTHVNAILLILPLGVAASSGLSLGYRAVARVLVLVLTTLLTLSPWLIRDAVVMHQFVPLTDEGGLTLAGTYNATSAHAQPPYRWLYYANVPADAHLVREASKLTETQLNSRLTDRAFAYIAHHPASLVGAAWHNSLRLLELEGSRAWKVSAASIGLTSGAAQIGVVCFWALCGLALLGLIAPPGLRAPGWLWAIPVLMWLSTVLVNAETPRFRSVIDPFLILLGARGLARLARWSRARPAPVTGAGVSA